MVSSGSASTGPCSDSHDLLIGAARQIGAANRAGEQRVSGDQFLLRRKVQTDAALGVPGSVQDVSHETAGS